MWRVALANQLERGSPPGGPVAKRLHEWSERRWSAGVCRPLDLPGRACTIGVGGATLGGSGKTPLAIALCAALAERGHDVAFVGHAYGASPGTARLVVPSDDVRDVGDEALVAADALAGRAIVVVAGSRRAATEFAAARARVLVFDGLLQTHPRRLSRSVLALDASAPWGAGYVPPFGDLRAAPRALVEASDAVAVVGDAGANPGDRADGLPRVIPRANGEAFEGGFLAARPAAGLFWQLREACAKTGEVLKLEDARGLRCGLLLGLARPERVVHALERRHVRPVCTVTWADHRMADAFTLRRASIAARHHGVQVWLTTMKCRTRLPAVVASAPVLALRQELSWSARAIESLLGETCLR